MYSWHLSPFRLNFFFIFRSQAGFLDASHQDSCKHGIPAGSAAASDQFSVLCENGGNTPGLRAKQARIELCAEKDLIFLSPNLVIRNVVFPVFLQHGNDLFLSRIAIDTFNRAAVKVEILIPTAIRLHHCR